MFLKKRYARVEPETLKKLRFPELPNKRAEKRTRIPGVSGGASAKPLREVDRKAMDVADLTISSANLRRCISDRLSAPNFANAA